jgi:hypothetical protein
MSNYLLELPDDNNELISVNGKLWTRTVIKAFMKIITSPRKFPQLIESAPGVGKNFSFKYLFPTVYKAMTGRACSILKCVPHKLKNIKDLFVSITFTQNSFEWIYTPLTSSITETRSDLILLIDEFTRINPEDQNIFLDVLEEEQSIHLEQMGKAIELPPYSRVILLCNLSGGGVFPLNGAIEDRINIMRWELPSSATILAKQALSLFNYTPKTFEFKGETITQQELDFRTAEIIISALLALNERVGGFNLSFRNIEQTLNEFIQDRENLTRYLRRKFDTLAEESDTTEYAIVRELERLENRLYNGRQYKRTGSSY